SPRGPRPARHLRGAGPVRVHRVDLVRAAAVRDERDLLAVRRPGIEAVVGCLARAPPRDRHVTRPARPVALPMAVESDCWQCGQLAGLVAAQLRPLGIAVTQVPVADVAAAIRAPGAGFDVAALATELPHPAPAWFLARMLGRDVPQAWLPAATRLAVGRLDRLSGARRDRAAVALARRLADSDVPVVAHVTPQIGMLLRSEL